MRQDESVLLERMYEEYLVPLKKYAASLGAQAGEAEDLAQETFIEYYERYSLENPQKVKMMLLIRILRSRWIDSRRRLRRVTLRMDDPEDRISILEELIKSDRMTEVLDQEVQDRELYRTVWEIVKKMKKNWREVLALRVIEGLSVGETCEILKISGTVCRSRLFRAKKELRRQLEKADIFDRRKT